MTDQITIPRALLEQALNAIQLPCDRWNGVQSKIVKAAADAVQAELAKPDRPIKDSWHFERLDRLLSLCLSEPAYSDYLDSLKRVAGFSAELAEPVEQAEPVAWLYSVPGHRSSASCERIPLDMTPRGTAEAPLYLHPPTPAWCDAPEVAALKAERDELPATQKTFESWAGKRERYHTTREWDAMHRAWQAATAAERERCAKVCDAIAYEWRGANSQSVQCANAIRKGE